MTGTERHLILHIIQQHLTHEAYVSWVQNFFFHEPYLSELVSSRFERVFDFAEVLDDQFIAEYVLPAQQVWKLIQKSRCNLYKEDLMIYTWHPSRFVAWCFDEDDKRDLAELPP